MTLAPCTHIASKATDVVALYVDPRGPYPELVAEAYDAARDARTYTGSLPVVAHPPCGPWSSLRGLSQETTKALAPHAVELVRRLGGVLEHPAGSLLWPHCGLPKPGALPDAWGGITYQVDQCDWGHVARKRSWIYVVGLSHKDMPLAPEPREPTHWCSGVHTPGARGKPPPGIKIASAQQRRRTPRAFAEWLIEIARRCSVPSNSPHQETK
jgi:hypothetical protein